MMIKQKEVRICDQCRKEITLEFFKLERYGHEGCSTLSYNGRVLELDNADFCCFDCFLDYVASALTD